MMHSGHHESKILVLMLVESLKLLVEPKGFHPEKSRESRGFLACLRLNHNYAATKRAGVPALC